MTAPRPHDHPDDPSGRHLVAVLDDQSAGRRLVGELAGLGVAAASTPRSSVESEQAEARAELEDGLVAPPAAVVLPKEAVRGLRITVPVAALAGALLALPLSAFPIEGWSWWARALLVATIGAAAGGTVGFLVGAGLGVRGPHTPSAAREGVAVSIPSTDPAIVATVVRHHPIRLDLLDGDGEPVGTLFTEDDPDPQSSFERMREQLTQPPGGRHAEPES